MGSQSHIWLSRLIYTQGIYYSLFFGSQSESGFNSIERASLLHKTFCLV